MSLDLARIGMHAKHVSAFFLSGVLLQTPALAAPPDHESDTKTPIKHVVVIFQENHPHALNLPGETPFHASPNTQTVNNLTFSVLSPNPNSAPPTRLAPSQANTCSHSHDYTGEQKRV